MATRFSGRLVVSIKKGPLRGFGAHAFATYDVTLADARGRRLWQGHVGRDELAPSEDVALDRAARTAIAAAHELRAATPEGHTVDHLAGYSATRDLEGLSPWIIRREKSTRPNPARPKRTRAACARAGKNLTQRRSTRAGKALRACAPKRRRAKAPRR